MKRLIATLVLSAAATTATAQWLSLPTPGVPRTPDGELDVSAPAPRTADGRPDLSGLWVPAAFEGSLFEPDAVQEWAQSAALAAGQEFFASNPRFHCLPSGPAYLTAGRTASGLRRIVQSPNMIVFLYSDMIYRQIYMDGRELEPDPFPTWMGYSVGRWDGDTLIVESNGYNDRTWLHRRGLPHTDRLRMTERYRRPSFGRMQMDITFDDPGTADAPLEAHVPMDFVADAEIMESVCNEAAEARSHWGGEVMDAQEDAIEVAEEILEGYVGRYVGHWNNRPVTIDILVENGDLLMQRSGAENEQRNGEQQLRLIPRSDTSFDCSCGWGYIFRTNDRGAVTAVDEIHVSGAWTMRRVPSQ